MILLNLDSKRHYGTVLNNGKTGSWDEGEASFCHSFTDPDEPKKIYLFYTGSNIERSYFAIGLAISHNGKYFKKVDKNPLLEGYRSSFFAKGVLVPTVIKAEDKYYLIFTGTSDNVSASLGIACAEDPKGPWKIISELIKPEKSWEGSWIEVGPGYLVSGTDLLIFYSNLSIKKMEAVLRWFHSPHLTRPTSYRYQQRRIGILQLRINSLNKLNVKVQRYANNPLIHLNGKRGCWKESLFCPGSLKVGENYYLFPACSTYSVGHPFRQFIGMIASKSPFFEKEYILGESKIIDGPSEKKYIMDSIQSEIALDTPSPILRPDENKTYLYYASKDRANHKWNVALTTFDLLKSNG